MKATIKGIKVEGTAEEMAKLITLIKTPGFESNNQPPIITFGKSPVTFRTNDYLNKIILDINET